MGVSVLMVVRGRTRWVVGQDGTAERLGGTLTPTSSQSTHVYGANVCLRQVVGNCEILTLTGNMGHTDSLLEPLCNWVALVLPRMGRGLARTRAESPTP